MSRRRFLRRGIAGAVLLGAGGLLAHRCSGYEVPDRITDRLTVLRPKEVAVLFAVAGRVLRGASPAPEVEGMALALDRLIARLESRSRSDLMQLLNVIEHLLPLRSGHVGRFTRLEGSARDDVLRAMERSSIGMLRGAFDALKSLCCLAYYGRPGGWAAIGYDGPLVGRPAGGWR